MQTRLQNLFLAWTKQFLLMAFSYWDFFSWGVQNRVYHFNYIPTDAGDELNSLLVFTGSTSFASERKKQGVEVLAVKTIGKLQGSL